MVRAFRRVKRRFWLSGAARRGGQAARAAWKHSAPPNGVPSHDAGEAARWPPKEGCSRSAEPCRLPPQPTSNRAPPQACRRLQGVCERLLRRFTMTKLLQILSHTPPWVFALFLLLLTLGVRQMRDTRVRPARLAVMPAVMAAWSLYGVISAFGLRPAPVTAWLVGAALALSAVIWRPLSGVRYDPPTRSVQLPGSAAPLGFMMGIFFTKYAVNVALATHPALRDESLLMLIASALYGSFSGLFGGRAVRVVRHLLRLPAFQRESLS